MGEKRRSDGSSPTDYDHRQKRSKGASDRYLYQSSSPYNGDGHDRGSVPRAHKSHKQAPSKQAFPIDSSVELPPIKSKKLRKAIFTHPNSRNNKDAGLRDDSMTYEPLEFLGDAYIELAATRLIHDRFPHFNTGERSRTREMMVKNETLAEFSKMYGWDEAGVIKLSGTEREDGGMRWTKILGDVFEAYVGAIAEDSKERGFETLEQWLKELWEPYLVTLKADADANPRLNVGELKDRLQVLLMNPRAGVKIEFVHAVPPRLEKEKGSTWYTKEVVLTGWGHTKRVLGRGESLNGKAADALAIKSAFENNMDLIMAANKMKKEFEKKAQEEKQAEESRVDG